MPRTFSRSASNFQIRDQPRMLFAAGFAIALHLLLLLVSPLSPYPKESFHESGQTIKVQINQPVKPEPIQAETSIPVVGPTPQPVVAPEVLPDSSAQEKEDKIIIAAPLTAATLQRWSKLETDKLLRNNPKALSDFEASFSAPKVVAEPKQTSFKSGYGDTHVVSNIGGKQVCYMQSQEHPQDDWSKGVVMFYDCAPKKDKFTLEIP